MSGRTASGWPRGSAAGTDCSRIRLALLDRLLLDRVEQQQCEPEVVVPEGSPSVGSLPDPCTATEAFFASTIRARANKAWKRAGLEPITPHEARHCAISYFIAAGLDWKQISTWAGHGDVRQTWNRYGHLVPGGEGTARERLDAFLTPAQAIPTVARTVAHGPNNDETPSTRGL